MLVLPHCGAFRKDCCHPLKRQWAALVGRQEPIHVYRKDGTRPDRKPAISPRGYRLSRRIPWHEQMRVVEQVWASENPDLAKILVVDHASDLDPVEVAGCARPSQLGRSTSPCDVLGGNLDVRALHAAGFLDYMPHRARISWYRTWRPMILSRYTRQ